VRVCVESVVFCTVRFGTSPQSTFRADRDVCPVVIYVHNVINIVMRVYAPHDRRKLHSCHSVCGTTSVVSCQWRSPSGPHAGRLVRFCVWHSDTIIIILKNR